MIRVGIGGWTFEPWRGTFFPDKLPHARELEYASRQVTAIELTVMVAHCHPECEPI